MIEVVPAKPQHVGPIAVRMREVDKLECEAMGHSPKGALRNGLLGSTIVWTVMIDGRPEAMMGASPICLLGGRGRPWLLMTDVAVQQRKSLVRLSKLYVRQMHMHYPVLENWVAAENILAIRYLARLGFAIGSVDVIGGLPMRPFVRHR